MRVVWIGIVVALAAVAVWWLGSGSTAGVDDDVARDDGANETARAGLEGRADPLVADAETATGPGSEAVRGIVEDLDGNPLPGMRVELHRHIDRTFLEDRAGAWFRPDRLGHPEPYELLTTTATGEDGQFAFPGLPKSGVGYQVRVIAKAPWFSGRRHANVGWYNRFLRIQLGKGAPLRLRVVDAGGRGLQAFVSGYRQREGAGWFPASFGEIRTSRDGRASVVLPDGVFQCSVTVPGKVTRYGVMVETPQSGELLIPVGIEGGASVEGSIRDTSGAPVAGAHVYVESGGPHESLSLLTRTAGDGSYRVDGLLPMSVQRVAVTADGYLTIDNGAPGLALRPGRTARVDLTMVRGGVIEGTVRGADGRAIAGAQVQARAEHTRQGFVGIDRAVTDRDGRYRMSHVPLGGGHVLASALGYFERETKGTWYVIDGESDRKTIDITLLRGIPVHGRVVDAYGDPVAHASVTVNGVVSSGWWNQDARMRVVTTDAHGRFAYPGLPPGDSWKLTATTASSTSPPVSVRTAMDTEPPAPVELVLRRTAVVEGRVALEADASRHRLRAHARAEDGANQTTAVLADGTFRLTGLQPGAYEIYVVDWYMDAVSEKQDLTVDWGQVVKDVSLDLLARHVIAGVVVDEDGEPIPELRLSLDISTPTNGRSLSADTNRRGRFVFTSVPDTGFSFTISIDDERKPGVFKPGDTDVRLQHRSRKRLHFEGEVHLPDGSPAVSGSVTIWEVAPARGPHQSGRRNGRAVPVFNGAFGTVIEQRSPDARYHAEVREVFDAVGKMISIRPAKVENVEPDTPITFHLVAGHELSGVVVDDEGAPVADVRVSIRMKDAETDFHRKNMQTRPDGTFWFGSISPGAIEVKVERLRPPWIAPPPLTVEAGDEDVRITLVRGGTVRGIVRGPDGKPVQGADVRWHGGLNTSVGAQTDEAGRFELFPIAPETESSVTVTPPESNPPMMGRVEHGVRAGTDDVELRLDVGAYIEGEIAGPDGEDVPHVWLWAHAASTPQQGGYHAQARDKRFKLGPLPPGRYLVRMQVSGGDFVAPDPLEIEAPASDVRIVVPKGRTITGTLSGASNLDRYTLVFMRLTPDGPVGMGGGVTASGQFQVTLKDDAPGTLFVMSYQDEAGLYALAENVRPSSTPLTLTLRQGATIEGRFDQYEASEQGYVYVQAANGVNVGATAAEDGSFVIRSLPPGAYDLHASRSRQALAPMRVKAGTRDLLLGKP